MARGKARDAIPGRCAACGAGALRLHLRVAGEMGPDGLVPTTDRFGTALADVARCAVCGHGQLHPMPDAATLTAAYGEAASDEYEAEEAGQRATAQRALDMIERHTAPGALLDVGCWLGFLLDEARTRGWSTLGLEPSAFAAARARERFGLEVRGGDLEGAADLRAGSFDAVVMGDVLEHLPDAVGALRRVGALLAPGGVLWLAVPNAGSAAARALGPRWWSVIPTHVHYFTPTSLFVALGRAGLAPRERRTDPKVFTVRYYLDRLRGYAPPVAGALVGAAAAAGVADRMVAPDFGDRLAVAAQPQT
jgi:SAM-dependent methyltransferase